MITINGSFGEGGGQILRSSLALSLCTGQPFRIENIRAGRDKPGLMRQHLTAVQAAAHVGKAAVEGAAIGSPAITFTPARGKIQGGDYHFAVGTAGSTTLVLQTILPALLTARNASTLTLEGGTHNPFAPPFDFLAKAFLPLINRMGPRVDAVLEKPGFYPAGGGRMVITIYPVERLGGLTLMERGPVISRAGRVLMAGLPGHVAGRELGVIAAKLNWPATCLTAEEVRGSAGPGNVVVLELGCQNVTEVFTGFGERHRSAESVAQEAVDHCKRYLQSTAPVGEYLTDQLLLPLALAGSGGASGGTSGGFRCVGLSSHATTHIELIGKFLDTTVKTEAIPAPGSGTLVTVG